MHRAWKKTIGIAILSLSLCPALPAIASAQDAGGGNARQAADGGNDRRNFDWGWLGLLGLTGLFGLMPRDRRHDAGAGAGTSFRNPTHA